MIAVGVDAYKGGWIAVPLEGGQFGENLVRRSFAEILSVFRDAEAIGVDIPIGLPERPARPADLDARIFVGPRRSSVFPTYPRDVLSAPTYADARALCRSRAWPVISAQSYALRDRILEVEAALEDRVIEVHPEVSFRERAGRDLASKHTPPGLTERALLVGLPDVRDHDLLDAAVAAWTADRYARGAAEPMPADASGRGVIWR